MKGFHKNTLSSLNSGALKVKTIFLRALGVFPSLIQLYQMLSVPTLSKGSPKRAVVFGDEAHFIGYFFDFVLIFKPCRSSITSTNWEASSTKQKYLCPTKQYPYPICSRLVFPLKVNVIDIRNFKFAPCTGLNVMGYFNHIVVIKVYPGTA